jgi:hypothetical protein
VFAFLDALVGLVLDLKKDHLRLSDTFSRFVEGIQPVHSQQRLGETSTTLGEVQFPPLEQGSWVTFSGTPVLQAQALSVGSVLPQALPALGELSA